MIKPHFAGFPPPVLTEKIEELGNGLKSHFNIEELAPVSLPAQVQMLQL